MDDQRRDEQPDEANAAYEPPALEDLDHSEGPSVTAAGVHITVVKVS